VKLKVQHETFSLKKYNRFLQANRNSIAEFNSRRQHAFDEERARWEAAGQSVVAVETAATEEADAPGVLPTGWVAVFADVPGNIWKVETAAGKSVKTGDRLAIIESMKMEIAVLAPADGVVADVFCAEGRVVTAGQVLFSIRPGF
jgi:urea carboxylase